MQRHASHGAPRSYRAQTTPPKQRKVVLCIDDGASGLAIRKLMLEEAGYEVATCCNGNQGLELFFTRPVHIVLLDYALPGLNGMEVAKLMREAKPEVPIIMLSGSRSATGQPCGCRLLRGERRKARLPAFQGTPASATELAAID